MNRAANRVVIAAPGSGHGKTTIATGVMAAVTLEARRGDGEDEATTLDFDQGGLSQHDLADSNRGEVVELDPRGHTGLLRGQVPVGGAQRRARRPRTTLPCGCPNQSRDTA